MKQILSQTQILAPIMVESLKLLELPQLQLKQYLEQQIEQNPVLEKENNGEGEVSLPTQPDNEWDEYPFQSTLQPRGRFGEPAVLYQPTLKEWLMEQINATFTKPNEIRIAEYIANSINDDGYLMISLEEIANTLHENINLVNKVYETFVEFDPIGIGCRDLRHCLLVQLKKLGRKLEAIIIERYFDKFAHKKYNYIARKLGTSTERITKAQKIIASLNPRPAKLYEGKIPYVIPDVVIKKKGGKWEANLNDGYIPHLIISRPYRKYLQNPTAFSDKEKKYLENKFEQARNVILMVKKRKETILKLTNYVIQKEKEFLERGPLYISSFTLEDVAKFIDANPSTVSRTIKGKYIQTPRGIIKFADLLSGGKLKNFRLILSRIKKFIEEEDKKNPLSDTEIKMKLAKEGFNIARTTVVKYRHSMGIPSAKERK
jgi:RNA polymerase sigma-54 factor